MQNVELDKNWFKYAKDKLQIDLKFSNSQTHSNTRKTPLEYEDEH